MEEKREKIRQEDKKKGQKRGREERRSMRRMEERRGEEGRWKEVDKRCTIEEGGRGEQGV